MKRNAPMHPKTLTLASMLDLRRYEAVGLLELLWHFAAQFCPQGDVGKRTDAQIAAALDWPQDRAAELMKALVDCGWLDTHPEHRLVVHDWHDHADGTCDKYLSDHGLKYATSRDPRRKSGGSAGYSRDKSRQVATSRDSRAGARVPEPESEPEPSPQPPSGGLEGVRWLHSVLVSKTPDLTEEAVLTAAQGCDGATAEQIKAAQVELTGMGRLKFNPVKCIRDVLGRIVHPVQVGGRFEKRNGPPAVAERRMDVGMPGVMT